MSRHVPPAWPSTAPPAQQGQLCRRCGHSLRGLTTSDRCPGCGAAAGFSLDGDRLRYADPAYVRALRRGATAVVTAVLIGICCAVVNNALTVLNPKTEWPRYVALATGTLFVLIYCAGLWMLTTPDPFAPAQSRGGARRLVRILLLANFLMPPAMVCLGLLSDSALAVLCGIAAVVLLLYVGEVVLTFAQLRHLHNLSRRTGDKRLADRARFLFFALGISAAAFTAAQLTLEISIVLRSSAALLDALLFVVGVIALPALVFGVMYILMLDRLRRTFADELHIALTTWASAPSPRDSLTSS